MTRVQRHMFRVADLGCILCHHLNLGSSPAQVHHLFRPEDRSDWLVAPLCQSHHQGPNGFHGLGGEPGFSRRYNLTEAALLAMTLEAMARSA